jgi:hypothetical protein
LLPLGHLERKEKSNKLETVVAQNSQGPWHLCLVNPTRHANDNPHPRIEEYLDLKCSHKHQYTHMLEEYLYWDTRQKEEVSSKLHANNTLAL